MPIGKTPARRKRSASTESSGRHEVLEDSRTAGHRKTDDRIEFFEGKGQTMQRPKFVAMDRLAIGLVGEGETLFVRQLGDYGIYLGIEPVGLSEECGHDFPLPTARGCAYNAVNLTSASEADFHVHQRDRLYPWFFGR